MDYRRFINEQTDLTAIALAYKNNSEFQKKLDADPRSIFTGDLAQTDMEVVIKQNSDDDYYFVLTANMSYIINDEEAGAISAAKDRAFLEYHTIGNTADGLRSIYLDAEGNQYRRYKSYIDSFGSTHFIKVELDTLGTSDNYVDVGKPIIIK